MVTMLEIRGKLLEEPRERNNVVEFLIKDTTNDGEKNNSIFYIRVNKKQWESIKDYHIDNEVILKGIPYAKIDKKRIPFIFVQCKEIGIVKKQKTKSEFKKKQQKNIKPAWYTLINEDEWLDLQPYKIEIKEKDHLSANLPLKLDEEKREFVAVNKISDDKYILISGVRAYIRCKILNISVKAYVTELTYKEFKEKYCY
ncbi:MAG: hypothetical protein RRY19_09810 [Clostridium sp.]